MYFRSYDISKDLAQISQYENFHINILNWGGTEIRSFGVT